MKALNSETGEGSDLLHTQIPSLPKPLAQGWEANVKAQRKLFRLRKPGLCGNCSTLNLQH